MSSGIAAETAADDLRGREPESLIPPRYCCIATARVQFLRVSILTSKNSWYTNTRVNRDVVIIPGHIIGIMTLIKASNLDAPSTIAASSISLGISLKKLLSI